MPRHEALMVALGLTWLAFVFSLGAIVGSFLNVVAYRLPAGKSLVRPPSTCPSCLRQLRFLRENLPILGWLLLKGRCRFCKAKVSVQYPLVELITALLFCVPYVLWFMPDTCYALVGVDPALLRPEWITRHSLTTTWPMLVWVWVMMGCLISATLIDARTFYIPLWLTWIMAIVGVGGHLVHAVWVEATRGGLPLRDDAPVWVIPTLDGPWLAMTLGAALGLGIAVLLLKVRVIPRSFADYEAWEREAFGNNNDCPLPCDLGPPPTQQAEPGASDTGSQVRRAVYLTAPAIALMSAGCAWGLRTGHPMRMTLGGMVIGLLIGLLLRRTVGGGATSDEPVWVQYPHARREMMKEALFLLPVVVLGLIGWWLASGGPLHGAAWLVESPLWLRAVGGSMAGYLAGGAVVWAVRLLGSLAFGKEAMGLGDVHLMAGVGAITGWAVPVLAFFVAPFIAIGWYVLAIMLASVLRRHGTALPFGPHLAAATLLVVLAHPVFEWALGALVNGAVRLL